MRFARPLVMPLVALAAACGGADLAQPVLDDLEPSFAKTNARALCRPTVIQPGANVGTVTTDDCVFNNGSVDQYEDIYLVPQGRLGTGGGSQMATFALEAPGFHWIFGLGGQGRDVFPNPVYAFRRGAAGNYVVGGFKINTFSLIGGEGVYKMWVGGQGPAQLGDYTLTATAEPVSNTCAKGHRVYLQGTVTFSSSIDNDTACRGTVQFGPYAGAPLNYQYWWIRVFPGETVTLAVDGVQHASMAAAIIDFGTNQAQLDLGDGPGDADRFVSFTATQRTDLYVEVSSAPDVVSTYTATVSGPGTH